MSVTEIARELGVSKPTVCFHKRSLGVAPDSRFSRRYDWALIREFYDCGHSMRECQQEFGFSGATWTDAIERGDIVPRPRAAATDIVFAVGHRNRYHLKGRLLKDGLREASCEECGLVARPGTLAGAPSRERGRARQPAREPAFALSELSFPDRELGRKGQGASRLRCTVRWRTCEEALSCCLS
jgi:hypothetical protein